ncbi:MAG: hypothetical protein AB1510_10350 [Bacillota bacterium]
MQDTVYSGTIAGTIGGLVKLAINLVLYVLGVAKTTSLHMAAAALLPRGVALNLPSSLMVGLAVDWLVAVALGIIGVYIVRLTGRDFLWLKGVVYGGLIWVVGCGYLATAVVPAWLLRPDPATSVSVLAAHLAYGLTALFVAGRYKIEAV